jgi:hypothetical protein
MRPARHFRSRKHRQVCGGEFPEVFCVSWRTGRKKRNSHSAYESCIEKAVTSFNWFQDFEDEEDGVVVLVTRLAEHGPVLRLDATTLKYSYPPAVTICGPGRRLQDAVVLRFFTDVLEVGTRLLDAGTQYSRRVPNRLRLLYSTYV